MQHLHAGNTNAELRRLRHQPQQHDRPRQPDRADGGTPSTARSRPATAWTTTATGRSTRGCRPTPAAAPAAARSRPRSATASTTTATATSTTAPGRPAPSAPSATTACRRLQPGRHPGLQRRRDRHRLQRARPSRRSSEVCNGLDDNCDGQIDNRRGGMLPGVGETCGNGLGACQSGTIVCKNGKLQLQRRPARPSPRSATASTTTATASSTTATSPRPASPASAPA